MSPDLDFDMLSRYLANELSQEERKIVEDWASESADNRKRLQNLQEIWAASALADKFSAEGGWDEIKYQLQNRTEGGETKERVMKPYWFNTLRIAAGLLIVIASGWLIAQFLPGGEVIESGSHVRVHSLRDGSVVTLNQGSELRILDGFGDKQRVVQLEGEAYFSVHKGTQPFVVRAGSIEAEVVGTEFNISATETKFKEVSVFEGVVLVRLNSLEKKLMAGDKVVIADDQKFVDERVDPNDLFWKTRKLTFRNVPLEDAITEISVRYQTLIALNPATRNCYLSTEFEQTPLEEVLAILASMYDLEVTEQQDVITLSGPGCD